MRLWLGMGAGLAAVLSAACSGGETAANNAGAAAEPANAAAPQANAAVAQEPEERPAAPTYRLTANGLAPGLDFGLAETRAIELATAAFGAPTRREEVDCPGGAMKLVRFQDLELVFEEGRFTGWSMNGQRPTLGTAGGVTVGAPRAALGDTEIGEDEGFGPGFSVDGVSGVLDENGRRFAGLSAGSVCEFG